MAIKRGEKFLEEQQTHGNQSPGVVENDEELERRLPPGTREAIDGAVPVAAFPRKELQWTAIDGGASVHRSQYAKGRIAGHRGPRGTIKATAGDIRKLTDREGNRLWSITDRPVADNRAHAEIQREPRGKMPDRSERKRFLEAWRGAVRMLAMLKTDDPRGKPELRVVPDSGVEVHWKSSRDENPRRIVQVESVAEAMRAYVGAGIVAAADAAQEQYKLEQELESRMRTARDLQTGTESGW